MPSRADRPNLSPEQELRILELDAQFKTQKEIAKDMGIAQSTVSQALARLSATLADDEQFTRLALQIKVRHANRYAYIAGEAMAAWELSKQPRRQLVKRQQTKTSAAKPGKDEEEEEASDIVETTDGTQATQSDREGNAAYLTAAMAAMDRIENLLGLKAPTKLDIRSPSLQQNNDPDAIHKRIIDNPEATALAHQLLAELDG